MKNKIWILLFWGLVVGCSDFLEESSQDEVRPSTVDDLMQVMVGEAYPMDFLIADYYDFLTDDVQCNGTSGEDIMVTPVEQFYSLFAWADELSDDLNTNNNINSWKVYYNKIMGCNTVLGFVDRVEGEQKTKDNMKGQALVLRAWYYFMLVNVYGLPYNYGDPNENLGVPLKLEMEVSDDFFKRESVATVYARVEQDLLDGIKLLEANDIPMSLYKISPLAAKAILSRVYLYMERWDDALEYANQVLSVKSTLTSLASAPEDVFQQGSESEFGIYNEMTSDEIIWMYGGDREFSLMFQGGGMNYPSAYSVSDDLRDLYETSTDEDNHLDLRPYVYFYNAAYFTSSWLPVVYPRYGFKGSRNLKYASKGIRTAELYLNRAEVYVRKYMESGDDTYRRLALEDLNKLRLNRYDTRNTAYIPVDIQDADELWNFYKEERRRELCFEDHRWFDLRRFGMPEITHVYLVNPGTEQILTLHEKDPRYVLPIPQEALDRNPYLVQNER